MKNQIKQIRLKENQINNIEEIAGNYPTEAKQIELNFLYSELRELKKKQAKETLETLRGICIKNWNIYCMNPTLKNWQKHLKATTNYNQVFMWLEKKII